VWADTSPLNERNLAPLQFLPRTADFLYLRLLGDYATKYGADGKHLHRYDKLLWKREAALESWALRIERHLAEVRNVWAFAGNHFEGFAPETCQRLAQRLGFGLPLPSEAEQAAAAQDREQLDLLLRSSKPQPPNPRESPSSKFQGPQMNWRLVIGVSLVLEDWGLDLTHLTDLIRSKVRLQRFGQSN